MAKGQMRSTREKKKPKADKKVIAAPTASIYTKVPVPAARQKPKPGE